MIGRNPDESRKDEMDFADGHQPDQTEKIDSRIASPISLRLNKLRPVNLHLFSLSLRGRVIVDRLLSARLPAGLSRLMHNAQQKLASSPPPNAHCNPW